MISISQLSDVLRRQLKKMAPGDGLSVRCYKGARGFLIKRTDDGFQIIEDGFHNRELNADDVRSATKMCLAAAKREFPRSRQLHVRAILGKDASDG